MKKHNPYTNVPPWINAYFQELRNGTRPIPYYALQENYDNVDDAIDALKGMDCDELNALVLAIIFPKPNRGFVPPSTFSLQTEERSYTKLPLGEIIYIVSNMHQFKNYPEMIDILVKTIVSDHCGSSPEEKAQELSTYASAWRFY